MSKIMKYDGSIFAFLAILPYDNNVKIPDTL